MSTTDPDVALLADLDAGLLPPDRAAAVRSSAAADPRSTAVLGALAATRAELAALAAPPVPPHVATRWAAALDAVSAGPGVPAASRDPGAAAGTPSPTRFPDAFRDTPPGTTSPPALPPGSPLPEIRPARPVAPLRRPRSGPARSGRPPSATLRLLPLLAAAALVVALVVGLAANRPDGRLDLSRVELAAVARSTIGTDDLGGLADPDRRAACLATLGGPVSGVAGGRQVRLDGSPGVLLVLTTGTLGQFRIVVVDPGCTVVLADETVGR